MLVDQTYIIVLYHRCWWWQCFNSRLNFGFNIQHSRAPNCWSFCTRICTFGPSNGKDNEKNCLWERSVEGVLIEQKSVLRWSICSNPLSSLYLSCLLKLRKQDNLGRISHMYALIFATEKKMSLFPTLFMLERKTRNKMSTNMTIDSIWKIEYLVEITGVHFCNSVWRNSREKVFMCVYISLEIDIITTGLVCLYYFLDSGTLFYFKIYLYNFLNIFHRFLHIFEFLYVYVFIWTCIYWRNISPK